jgi:hypothetical protein
MISFYSFVLLTAIVFHSGALSEPSFKHTTQHTGPSVVVEEPFLIKAVLLDGHGVGNLILGESELDTVVRMFPETPDMYEGNPRPPQGYPVVKAGMVIPQPTIVYNPINSLYVLFFDKNRRLVIVQESGSKLEGLTRQELLRQYPSLTETDRHPGWYEMQGEIQRCITMLVIIDDRTDMVSQVAYAFTCQTS